MIRITRERADNVKLSVAYRIYIDGTFRRKIRWGETKELNVESGGHKVWIRSWWWRSNKLHIDVSDSVVELEVGYIDYDSEDKSKSIEHLFFESIFHWDKFLWIRDKNNPVYRASRS